MDLTGSIDVNRIGQVLAYAEDEVLILGTDGRARSMPRVCIAGSMLPGDIAVLSGDGKLRSYLRSQNGELPLEALDAQLLAQARTTWRQADLGVPDEFAAHVTGQLWARMKVLRERGVVLASGRGLAPDWEDRYVMQRWGDLGVGVGGPEPRAGRIEGVGVGRVVMPLGLGLERRSRRAARVGRWRSFERAMPFGGRRRRRELVCGRA